MPSIETCTGLQIAANAINNNQKLSAEDKQEFLNQLQHQRELLLKVGIGCRDCQCIVK
jgi:GTP cyclohydrolase III